MKTVSQVLCSSVAIILLLSTAVGAQSSLTLVEQYRLTAAKEDYAQLGAVSISLRGHVLVAEPMDSRVRTYTADGSSLGRLGRKGAGPGEFEDLLRGAAGWFGDTAWVYDAAHKRITLLSTDAKLLRTIPLPQGISPGADSRPFNTPFAFGLVPSAMSNSAELVGVARMAVRRTTGTATVQAEATLDFGETVAVRIDLRNGMYTRIAGVPETQNVVQAGSATNASSAQVPFVARVLREVAPDRVAILAPTDAAAGTAAVRLTMLRSNGDTSWIRTYSFPGVRVTKNAIDSVMNDWARRSRQMPHFAEIQAKMRAAIPAQYPAVESIRFGLDGTLWLAMRPSRGEREWRALDEFGNPVGSLVLSTRVHVRQLSLTQLWAVEVDHDGLPNLVCYRVSKR